ncbi:DUF1642 domain-containing protein [Pediococcus pentosaceus]|uniref:DUF1642 domain-containing protein n=1 Tax=Pediococcus pentosaceus TaxID=1255 RepID=UPI0025710839|nr:DUF1642 domain-containing protein [Pediococcus pentosaceus]
MTKEELLKQLKKEKESTVAKFTTIGTYAHGMGYVGGLKKAIGLAEKLDEPKKVVIPKFVADWIQEAKEYYEDEISPLKIVYWIGEYIDDVTPHYEWLKNIDNQKLLLNAIANGYEVEKEKKYMVKIKGIGLEEEWLNCEVGGGTLYFELNSSTESEIYKTNFTKQWLKDNFPEYDTYNNAGLLEFEEVEDE